jgi:hypothetical protein
MLMICGSEVFVLKGLAMKTLRNNVADSQMYHLQGNAGAASYRIIYAPSLAKVQAGPVNA